MSSFAELETRVIAWAKDRGIFRHSDPKTQALKMASEAGELCDAVAKGDRMMVIDGIGDTVVTLILLSEMYDVDVKSCLEVALNVIEGRKGEMVNGVFCKES